MNEFTKVIHYLTTEVQKLESKLKKSNVDLEKITKKYNILKINTDEEISYLKGIKDTFEEGVASGTLVWKKEGKE